MTTISTPARTPAPQAELLSFGGCDYLGLSKRPEVIEALREHALEHGVSSSASRSTTGNRPAHESLERAIREFVAKPAAILLPEGYLANLALCQALATTHRRAVIDERAHASVHAAAVAAGMEIDTFPHLDAHAAGERMARAEDPAVLLTDGVFTADGATAPAPELMRALRPDDLLVLDECHALGVLGEHGRGSCEHWAIEDPRIMLTGTLAKGLGCYGGFVAGSREMVDRIRSTSSAYICTTPIPPALAHASERAIRIVREQPALVAKLTANARALEGGLVDLGLIEPKPIATPTFAVALRDDYMDGLAANLQDRGIAVPVIRYPGGPGARYLRFSVSSSHTPAQIDRLVSCIERWRRAMAEGVGAPS